jgi:hypothetical protein
MPLRLKNGLATNQRSAVNSSGGWSTWSPATQRALRSFACQRWLACPQSALPTPLAVLCLLTVRRWALGSRQATVNDSSSTLLIQRTSA